MQIRLSQRVALPLVGLGLGLALSACGTSDTSTASVGGASSSTAVASGAASTTGVGGASADAAGRDLCATVPADKVAGILGQDVASAKPLAASDRFRSANTLPGCKYLAKPSAAGELAVVSAEFLKCPDAEGVFTDPAVKRTELSGIGDKAMARADAIDTTLFIDTISKKGDQCLYVRVFQGAPEAKARQLTNLLLGA